MKLTEFYCQLDPKPIIAYEAFLLPFVSETVSGSWFLMFTEVKTTHVKGLLCFTGCPLPCLPGCPSMIVMRLSLQFPGTRLNTA